MIPRKYENLLFPFLMALFMSCIMSFVITVMNAGFVNHLLTIWLRAWAGAFVVAFPTILVVGPMVRRLAAWLLTDETRTLEASE
ncbi:DUF2798 domain-containing protein [Pseudoalteromonas xiamenensis]|uniref:DUF2798 domain-containing protein n=1 Tax=Pseudoalteromonas xiamenensis TaxID=882626 RepID=UPI0027E4FE14|nr:DUF2798 domain-containing protein [Pseudoalteromonas xiamenensis]WMN59620.1 DUF2798 domain-containing protein [Pseudoalteromonas xiamenensis]